MQYIFLAAISIPFLFINYKIIKSDFNNKIIPNKYLLKLIFILPLFYIYYFYFYDINLNIFLIQILISILISFVIYYKGIWSAGDAKYLLILALFIPNIGILSFIGNLGLITIIYLIAFFIYFYSVKFLKNSEYRKNLYIDIKKELKERWNYYKKENSGNNYKIIIEYILGFMTIFISVRLIKIYFIDNQIYSYAGNYNIYYILSGILLFILLIYFIRIIIEKIVNIINIKLNIGESKIKKILKILLFFIIILFGILEYYINKISILSNIYYIITIVLLYYLFFISIIYGYKLIFYANELKLIGISELKKGDIVDKNYLLRYFGKHKGIGFCDINENNEYKEKQKEMIMFPNPELEITKIENPITEDGYEVIKLIYSEISKWNKENGYENTKEEKNIVIVNTFAFAIYIFIGFITTFIFQNKILIFLLTKIIEKIKGTN